MTDDGAAAAPPAELAEAQPPTVAVAGPIANVEEAHQVVQMATVYAWALRFRALSRLALRRFHL
jgi:hypothetical protein